MPVYGKSLIALLKKYDVPTTPCHSQIGRGWIPIVEEMMLKLIDAGWDRKLDQVKEKFGLLRVYLAVHNEKWEAIVTEAEKKSSAVCYHCGNAGTMRQGGWWITLCDACDELRKKVRLNDVDDEYKDEGS